MKDEQNKKELPDDWKWSKLGNEFRTTSGGTPSRREPKYYTGKIPWVKSGELDKGLITDTEEKISEEAINTSSAKIFPKGTLLIALYGATIGKLAFLGVDAATNQAICGIYKNENINSDFLYHYLFFKKQKLVDQGIGGAQPNISQTILKNLDLPIPPKPIQQAIVSKIEELFSELDKGIENLLTAQQQLKIYRQSVLKWAFEGRLTNKNVKEGELPEGWKVLKLRDVTNKISIKALPKDFPDAKFVGMDCIAPHTMKPFFLYDFKEFKSAGSYFKINHVLYGRMRPYLNKVYKAEFNGACSGEFIILECSEALNPDLLKYILHSKNFVSFANSITTGDRPRISFDEISEYIIKLSPINEQLAIVQAIETRLSVADKMQETITQSLQQSEALRQSILKMAFEGKLV